jgi:hypothetical protein
MTRNRLALKLCLETIEDTKGVSGYRKSEDRQYNDPRKKGRRMITLHMKTTDCARRTQQKTKSFIPRHQSIYGH